MGQITIRELENMDFFKEIPKDILQNLLNESKVVSYKKKEVIFHSRSRTKTVYFVYSGKRTAFKSEYCKQKAKCTFL